MSLFGDLPAPKGAPRPKQDAEREYKPAPVRDDPLLEHARAEQEQQRQSAEREDGEPPEKRARVEGPGGGLSSEQVFAALAKIEAHISNPDKFPKACGLLRQLLESGSLERVHRDALFGAFKAAFADLDAASEPGLRRDYMKLCHAVDKHTAGLLSKAQRAQADVYRLVGFVQNEMHTDDSFVFNKVLARIKAAVDELPPADEADEEALAELALAEQGGSDSDDGGERDGGEPGDGGRGGDGAGSGREGASAERDGGAAEAAAAAAAAVAPAPPLPPPPPPPQAQEGGVAEDDADPFGLDHLLPQPPPPPPPPQQPQPAAARDGGGGGGGPSRSKVWTPEQALVMRRQALIECLITARGFHKTPWARTSVELLVEHYAKHRDRFAAPQREAVEEMVRFVKQARQTRATGPSQKELNRDSTSFERARSEWSRAKVSMRGKVGAQGDAKSQNWLG